MFSWLFCRRFAPRPPSLLSIAAQIDISSGISNSRAVHTDVKASSSSVSSTSRVADTAGSTANIAGTGNPSAARSGLTSTDGFGPHNTGGRSQGSSVTTTGDSSVFHSCDDRLSRLEGRLRGSDSCTTAPQQCDAINNGNSANTCSTDNSCFERSLSSNSGGSCKASVPQGLAELSALPLVHPSNSLEPPGSRYPLQAAALLSPGHCQMMESPCMSRIVPLVSTSGTAKYDLRHRQGRQKKLTSGRGKLVGGCAKSTGETVGTCARKSSNKTVKNLEPAKKSVRKMTNADVSGNSASVLTKSASSTNFSKATNPEIVFSQDIPCSNVSEPVTGSELIPCGQPGQTVLAGRNYDHFPCSDDQFPCTRDQLLDSPVGSLNPPSDLDLPSLEDATLGHNRSEFVEVGKNYPIEEEFSPVTLEHEHGLCANKQLTFQTPFDDKTSNSRGSETSSVLPSLEVRTVQTEGYLRKGLELETKVPGKDGERSRQESSKELQQGQEFLLDDEGRRGDLTNYFAKPFSKKPKKISVNEKLTFLSDSETDVGLKGSVKTVVSSLESPSTTRGRVQPGGETLNFKPSKCAPLESEASDTTDNESDFDERYYRHCCKEDPVKQRTTKCTTDKSVQLTGNSVTTKRPLCFEFCNSGAADDVPDPYHSVKPVQVSAAHSVGLKEKKHKKEKGQLLPVESDSSVRLPEEPTSRSPIVHVSSGSTFKIKNKSKKQKKTPNDPNLYVSGDNAVVCKSNSNQKCHPSEPAESSAAPVGPNETLHQKKKRKLFPVACDSSLLLPEVSTVLIPDCHSTSHLSSKKKNKHDKFKSNVLQISDESSKPVKSIKLAKSSKLQANSKEDHDLNSFKLSHQKKRKLDGANSPYDIRNFFETDSLVNRSKKRVKESAMPHPSAIANTEKAKSLPVPDEPDSLKASTSDKPANRPKPASRKEKKTKAKGNENLTELDEMIKFFSNV